MNAPSFGFEQVCFIHAVDIVSLLSILPCTYKGLVLCKKVSLLMPIIAATLLRLSS